MTSRPGQSDNRATRASGEVAHRLAQLTGFSRDQRARLRARTLLFAGPMLPVAPKKLFRDALIGFGIGLVLMLGMTYGSSMFAGTQPAAATSTH